MNEESNPLVLALLKLQATAEQLWPWAIEARLMTAPVPRPDYFAARIAREPVIRDAISESCLAWIENQPWPVMDHEQALFVADRFRYGYIFGLWLRENGFGCPSNSEATILIFLLNESWRQFSAPRWKRDLESV